MGFDSPLASPSPLLILLLPPLSTVSLEKFSNFKINKQSGCQSPSVKTKHHVLHPFLSCAFSSHPLQHTTTNNCGPSSFASWVPSFPHFFPKLSLFNLPLLLNTRCKNSVISVFNAT